MSDAPVRLDSLTGVRILAAVWVMLLHFRTVDEATTYQYPLIDSLVLQGNLGVDLFFVLSGFILSHVYFTTFRDGVARGAYRSFISYRFARLYPVHLVTFLIMMALYVVQLVVVGSSSVETPERYGPAAILQSLTMTHAWWGQESTPNVPAWSISSEWFAYLLFPLFCLAIGRFRYAGAAFAVGGVALAVLWQGNEQMPAQHLVRVIAGFLVGMAVYQLSKRTAGLARLPFLGILVSAAIVCWLAVDGAAHLEIGVVLFGALVLALSSGNDWLGRVLAMRPMVYLGEVSYSLYMVHWVVRVVVRTVYEKAGLQGVVAPEVMVAVYSACTLVAAILLYHLVERPWRGRLRTLLAPRRGSSSAVAS